MAKWPTNPSVRADPLPVALPEIEPALDGERRKDRKNARSNERGCNGYRRRQLHGTHAASSHTHTQNHLAPFCLSGK